MEVEDGDKKEEVNLGKLQFSLDYDFQKGEVGLDQFLVLQVFIVNLTRESYTSCTCYERSVLRDSMVIAT